MTADNKDPGLGRRGFLRGMGVIAGAAGIAAAAPGTALAAAPPPPPERDAGYRDSEHVRRYYELARF